MGQVCDGKANSPTGKERSGRNAYATGRQYHQIVVAAVIRWLCLCSIFLFKTAIAGHGKLFRPQQVSAQQSLTVGTLENLPGEGRQSTLGSVEWFAIYGLSMFLMRVFYRPCGQNSSSLVDRAEDAVIRTDMTVPDGIETFSR